ncbi:unnamed protein product, partial [Darwinula stevensoni]
GVPKTLASLLFNTNTKPHSLRQHHITMEEFLAQELGFGTSQRGTVLLFGCGVKLVSSQSFPALRHLRMMSSTNEVGKLIALHKEGESRIDLCLQYSNQRLGIKQRRFNFSRRVDEPLQALLSRMYANFEKATQKSKKKKENEGKQESGDNPKFEILEQEMYFLDSSGEKIASDRPVVEVLFQGNLDVRLKICDSVIEIERNPPTIMNLSLPSSIMAGFLVYPKKLEVEFATLEDVIMKWYISSSSSNSDLPWEDKGVQRYLEVTNADIGKKVKLMATPRKGEKLGEPWEVISKCVIEAGPGHCPFEDRHLFTQQWAPELSFRVISYNILADLYADSDHSREHLFPTCPPYALAMDYRRQLLFKEITGYRGDLICLQEVDTKVFQYDFLPTFSCLGYSGLFCRKGGLVAEGLAVFFQNSKFRLVGEHSFSLSEELQTNPVLDDLFSVLQRNQKLLERALQRTTTFQVVLLESVKVKGKYLFVGNTHLYFHPDADHIRLIQAATCMRLIEALIAEKFSGVNEEESCDGIDLTQPFPFASACGTPAYTNFTKGFNGCLDYIFYQKDRLTVEEVIPFPSHEDVTEHGALPSVTFPSDHLALIAQLAFKR